MTIWVALVAITMWATVVWQPSIYRVYGFRPVVPFRKFASL